MERLTKVQMQYLLSWVQEEGKKRSFYHLATMHGVAKSTVQRTMNVLVNRGVLNDAYELTREGKQYLDWYMPRFHSLKEWLTIHSIDVDTAESTAHSWLAVTEEPVLDMLLKNCLICSICQNVTAVEDEQVFEDIDLTDRIPEGIYEVDAEFLKDSSDGEVHELSMADEAFAKPARLVVSQSSSYLELKRIRLVHLSYKGTNLVGGKLRAMDYMVDGRTERAEIDGDLVRIPVRHLQWHCSKNKLELKGRLRIFVTCTAGICHMPKRPTMLYVQFNQPLAVRTS
ncbi:MAG: hypothetical protein ACRDBO_14260 [Lachnospiraceae bacterium]